MSRMTRISVAILTFIIGVAAVWLASEKLKTKRPPATEQTVTMVVPAPAPARFTPTDRGCGMGYGQGYELPNGQTMSEGSACSENSRKAKREWRKLK